MRSVTTEVFDAEAYQKFADKKKLEAEQKTLDAKRRAEEYQLQRQKKLESDLAKRQSLVAPILQSQDKSIASFQERKVSGAMSTTARQNIQSNINVISEGLQKDIENINKELSTYKPTKKVTTYESSYVYVDPSGKRTQIDYGAAKAYEQAVQQSQAMSDAELLEMWNTTGGAYIDKTGKLVSSSKSPKDFGINDISQKEYFKESTTPDVYKYFKRPENLTKVPTKIAMLNEDPKVIQERYLEVLPELQKEASKAYLANLSNKQRDELRLEDYSKAIQQTKNIQSNELISNKQQAYPIDSKTPIMITSPPTKQSGLRVQDTVLTTMDTAPRDISEKEFDTRIQAVKDYSAFDIALEKAAERRRDFQKKWVTDRTGYKDEDRPVDFFNNPVKDLVTVGYEQLTDVAGGIIATIQPKFDFIANKYSVKELASKRFLNPREIVVKDLEVNVPKRRTEDFYTGKLGSEVGALFLGGPIATVSGIGQASRGQNIIEVGTPLALGGLSRFAMPKLGAKLSSGITKLNLKLESSLTKLFGSKLPVEKDVLAISRFKDIITEDKVGKFMTAAGPTAEIIGLNLTPLEQKEAYIKQVGLINVLSPIGYRLTDAGIALSKFVGVKIVAPIANIPIFKAKEVMSKTTFDKFSKTGGGTPVARVSEAEQIASLQKGISKKIADRFGIDLKGTGRGAALRSVDVKLGKKIEPRVGNYEAASDFYSPELHPIALTGVGLKQRLFKPLSGVYDRFRLTVGRPSIEFTIAPRGTAITGKIKSLKDLINLKKIFSYKEVPKRFDLSAEGKKIGPKLKIDTSKTIDELQLEKILGGGRPFKNRDIKSLIGEEAFNKWFLAKDSITKKLGGYFSSQTRAIGATVESEVLLDSIRTRVIIPDKWNVAFKAFGKKFNISPSTIKAKLNLADAYVDVGFELVPMNIEQVVLPKVTALTVAEKALLAKFTQKQLTGGKLLLTGKQNLLSVGNELDVGGKVIPKSYSIRQPNPQVPVLQESGGYSAELSEIFGRVNAFSDLRIPIVNLSEQKQTSIAVKNIQNNDLVINLKSKTYNIESKPINVAKRIDLSRVEPRRTTINRVDIKRPDLLRPDTKRPDLTRPDSQRTPTRIPPQRIPTRITLTRPDIKRPTINRPDPRRPDPKRPDPTRPEIRRPPIRRPPIRTPPYKPLTRIIIPPKPKTGFIGKTNKIKIKQAFNVFEIRGKKQKSRLIGKELPIGRAILTGISDVTQDLGRTFFLQKIGLTDKPDVPTPRIGKVFRPPTPKSPLKKYGSLVFVQKAKYSLSSGGEKREIKQARLNR